MAVRRFIRPLLWSPPSDFETQRTPTAGTHRLVEAAAQAMDHLRGRHLFVLDLVGMVAATYLSLTLRVGRPIWPDPAAAYAPVMVILVATQLGANVRLGLYNRRWRFASVPDLERVAAAVVVAPFAVAVFVYGVDALLGAGWTAGLPRSFWGIEILLANVVVGGIRLAIRASSDLAGRAARPASTEGRATLLYGAGQAGALVARSALRDPAPGVIPVGFLDDDPRLTGVLVAGLRVFGGLRALEHAMVVTGAQSLLITMPSASGDAVRRVVDAALAAGLSVRTVPSINDLIDGTVDAYRIRNVHVEDLLRRPLATEHLAGVGEIIRGRTVLITGAAGSIGSELARQVDAIGPSRIVLVDRAESPLYTIQRELEGRHARGVGSGTVDIHLANVASRGAMERIIGRDGPDVIFHAAAYKHVPMMEDHPADAAFVNVGGTLAVLDAAAANRVERFVFVSTDKAVRPSSVMGASKRIAEMLVADAARRTGRSYVTVRFGNVLGSSGSVVPIFQEQLEKGEPLTITHPDMMRFFMTIPEAVWLILEAAALGRLGDLFVLDMGEPVRIMDLARDLIRLSGRDPDSQPLEITGLRPGEKLCEELFYGHERVEPTENAKVLRVAASPPPESIRSDVQRLLSLATGESDSALRAAMLAYARGSGWDRPMPDPQAVPVAHGEASTRARGAPPALTAPARH